MAGGSGGRSLEETSTWAVAVVCFVLVMISFFMEHLLHLFGKWLKKRHKRSLYEAHEKVKSELMLLGFISLLLTVGQGTIADICIPEGVAASWHPCSKSEELELSQEEEAGSRRRLLHFIVGSEDGTRRFLAGGSGTDKCAAKGKVSFMSTDGIHQLHIFIFVLAIFHVLYCILTMALGSAKMKRWKAWEKETRTIEYQFLHDPERFRFARETSFGRRHMRVWTKNPLLLWIVCFLRQFVRSVPKVDYLTLRHGFIMAHLAPQSQVNFDFQKYIKRSLEKDFKTVVSISPLVWFFAVLFLLFNTHGWYSYLWRPFIPLVIILLVGTKLQVIVAKMGLRIERRGEVVRGVPTVEPCDDLFWFNRPRFILYLINFVLFLNAFQLAFFAWSWYEFGISSCFHSRTADLVIRITMGVLIQFLCSYVTLPLYALVTQMGTNMRATIFNERVATALRKWHHTAKKNIKAQHKSVAATPVSSRPGTPSDARGLSPVHLLRHHHDSLRASPRPSDYDYYWNDTDGGGSTPASPFDHRVHPQPQLPGRGSGGGSWSSHHHGNAPELGSGGIEIGEASSSAPPLPEVGIVIERGEFSFDRRGTT